MIYLNELMSVHGLELKKIKSDLKKVLKYLDQDDKDLSVTFCDDEYIKKLNEKFRNKNKATDVLSFPIEEKGLLGDIIISLQTAAENAKVYSRSFSEEINTLLIHGLMHLLGFEHDTDKQYDKMNKKEIEIFKLIGGAK